MNTFTYLALPLVLISSLSFAERPCPEYYVDIADEDEGLYEHCDFTKSGLNGWIHDQANKSSASDKPSESAVASSSAADSGSVSDAASDNAPSYTEGASSEALAAQTILTEPAANAVQLQEQRFSTLQQLAKNCVNGYKIESESYQAVENSEQLQLAIEYQCL